MTKKNVKPAPSKFFHEKMLEEQELLNVITEKYGPGQLDPQTGVFTPSVEVTTIDEE